MGIKDGAKKIKDGSTKVYRYAKDDVLNIKEVNKNIDTTKEIIKNNFDPRNIKEGRVETFADAMERLNVSNGDLPSVYKTYYVKFHIFAFFFLLNVFMMCWFIFNQQIISIVVSIAAALVFFAHMFVNSFRAFQIRHRQLFSVKTWLQNKKEWIPSEFK